MKKLMLGLFNSLTRLLFGLIALPLASPYFLFQFFIRLPISMFRSFFDDFYRALSPIISNNFTLVLMLGILSPFLWVGSFGLGVLGGSCMAIGMLCAVPIICVALGFMDAFRGDFSNPFVWFLRVLTLNEYQTTAERAQAQAERAQARQAQGQRVIDERLAQFEAFLEERRLNINIELNPANQVLAAPPVHLANDVLLEQIGGLFVGNANQPEAENTFLSDSEIESYNKLIESYPDDIKKPAQAAMEKYKKYIDATCAFTLEPIRELKQPITVEGSFEAKGADKPRTWTHTFDVEELKKSIQQCSTNRKDAFDPVTRDNLTDQKHIIFYKGFSKEALAVVKEVKATLSERQRGILLERPLCQPDSKEHEKQPVSASLADNPNSLFSQPSIVPENSNSSDRYAAIPERYTYPYRGADSFP